MIASASNVGLVNVWDLRTGDLLQTMSGPVSLIGDLAFTKNGDKLAVAGSYFPSFGMEAINEIDLFDTESGELLIKFFGEGYVSVSSVSFTPDGTILASGCSDGIVRLWNVQTGDLVMKLEGHLKGVSNVEFSSDGTLLASGSSDGTIRLWGIP
jgi:WD40 repeat protein